MILDLLFLVFVALWSACVGWRLLERLDPAPRHAGDGLALAMTLGLGVLALATLALGEIGLLSRAGLAVVILPGFLLGWSPARRAFALEIPRADPGAIDLAFAGALGIAIVGTLLSALVPVTDGDALCYHLKVPKVFLERGAVTFDPDLHETVYPLVTELLYAVALAFRGPIACRLVQWLLGMLFAANVAAMARPSLGKRAWWAGVIALLVPAVSNGMTAPLNDVALAAFGSAAIVAWMQFQETPHARSGLFAGVAAGLALGVKYPALVLGALLGLTIAARPLFGRERAGGLRLSLSAAVRYVAVFTVAAIVVGGSWYARAWVHTGNPVYPFFRDYFGGAGLSEVLDPTRRAMAVTAWSLLTALASMTLHPDRFDSVSHQFGPVFLLFLPALLVEKTCRRVIGLAALGYTFLVICVSQRQSMRFVLIAVGPMSVAVAWLASAWHERRSLACRLLLTGLVVALLFESSIAAVRARQGLSVVLGRETADAFLSRREPTYRVGKWVEANLARDVRILGQDHRGFYIPRAYTMELAHRRRTGLGSRGESSRGLVQALQREGFTHVMLCPPVPETAVEFDPTLGRVLGPWLAGSSPLYREDLADADGVVRRYAIYALRDVIVGVDSDRRIRR